MARYVYKMGSSIYFVRTLYMIFLRFISCTAEVPLRTLTVEIALILQHFLLTTLKVTLN